MHAAGELFIKNCVVIYLICLLILFSNSNECKGINTENNNVFNDL